MSRFITIPGNALRREGKLKLPFRVVAKDKIITYWWEQSTLILMISEYGNIQITSGDDCTDKELYDFIVKINQ
jgi:hypothetical protein